MAGSGRLYVLGGAGSFLVGGFATCNTATRTRVVAETLTRPGLELVLEQISLHLASQTRSQVTLEIVHNGSTVDREVRNFSSRGRYLSLPWLRLLAHGLLEVYITQAGGNAGVAVNLSGRYVYARSLAR